MTLGFTLSGTALTVTGLKNDPQVRLTLDGLPIDPESLSWKGNSVSLILPFGVFDARSHRVTVTYATGPASKKVIKTESFTHTSVYEGELLRADDHVAGWISDVTRPGFAVEVDIDFDGEIIRTLRADAAHDFGSTGAFSFANPANGNETRLLGVRIRGTDYYPIGKQLIRLSAVGLIAALDGAMPGGEKARALDAFKRQFLINMARHREPVAFPHVWTASLPCHGHTINQGVDVIIPVYRGLEETMDCIDSVLRAEVKTPYNLIVINDASPDPALVKALKAHAAKHDYRLLDNAENLGFVATVNRGMSLNDDNDVVLLNSDTVVGDHWLDRLVRAAYSAPNIASATPLSNNATILTLPELGEYAELPYGLDMAGINALCARENDGVTVDLPTAHGFCMFIRRAALREVGLFDAQTFGKGYGEENDFSLRAATRGWRNIAACDAFVEHKGGVSFDNKLEKVAVAIRVLNERYPDYHGQIHNFLDTDPMAPVRNRLQISLWRDRPIAVFISLASGGGVDTNIEFLAEKLKGEGYHVLIARNASNGSRFGYALTEWGSTNRTLYPKAGGLDALCADLLILTPRFIHLHHLIDVEDGMDRFLKGAGIPYFVTLHDFFYACPRVTLLDDGGEYCDLPDFSACNTCLKRGGAHSHLHGDYRAVWQDIVRWRDKWHDLLKQADGLFAPSQATADLYHRVFAGLTIDVRSHLGGATPTVESQPITAPAKIKIALLGALGPHKGSAEIVALLRWAEKREPDLAFALIGYSDRNDQMLSFPNLRDFGPYTPETLEEKVRESGAQVALFLSPWPETYAYTLSEALTIGLTPVAYDLGAPGGRLTALGVGQLVPPDASHAQIIKAIRAAAATKITPKTYSEGEYASLIDDYYQLDRVHDDRRVPCLLLPQTEGLHDDAWATRNIVLRFGVRNEVNRLKLDLYVPESFGPQQARVLINGEDYGMADLTPGRSAQRLDLATRPMKGLIKVEVAFSFEHHLPQPDERMGAAKLGAASFEFSTEPVAIPVPSPISVRVRPSPDMRIEDLTAMDETGKLESLYRDVTSYALFSKKPGLLEGPVSLARDLLWSARIARRQGAKTAVKSFLAMRGLRKSSFDDTFYRMQLAGKPREGMDPVNHYVVFGAKEGFDPAPGFSSSFYLKAHEDLARTGVNPFFHYLRHGTREARRIEPSGRIGLFLHSRMGQGDSNGVDSSLGLSHTLLLGNAGTGSVGAGADTGWPKRDRPGDADRLTIHERRANDDILDVAYMGQTFLEQYGLLGKAPKWEAAVQAINALPRPSMSVAPAVSVIIPVYGQLAYTLNCLHSLVRQNASHRFEIVIGDDASPDDSERWLSQVRDVRYFRYPANEGFIATCNKTAAEANGKYLVFLNNDTRVADSWLDSLVDTFNHFPKVGMVGSKLFYPDGSLQEAGGIVWRDGSAWNYGRHDDPNRPAYSYARAVDYVSGASFMIRHDLWTKLEGFDDHYKPAYYEDTDLAFRIRSLGHSVIMQPLSKVVHYEGKTSGTDTAEGAKAYQVLNKEKFFERWRETLSSHRENGDKPSLERDRAVTKRVLIVDACNPTPSQDAGSKATVDLIRYYQTLGYHVSFVPEDNFLYQCTEVGALQAMGVECFYAPFERSMTELLRGNGALYDVVQVIRANVGFKNLELIRKYAPQAKVIYLNADLHFLRMQRQAGIENNDGLREEAEAMKVKELKLAADCDITLVHSDVERDILNDEVPDAKVAVLPLIEEIVDADVSHASRKDVMFLGGYNHPPNVDAANFLLDQVWPRLSAELPEARLLLVGANPPPELLARASDRVLVTGQVKDLAPWFGRSRLFLASLRYGAGLKGKVLSAMAHGVPVIATDIAAEGLEVENGTSIFIANTADEIVAKTTELYGQSGREWNRHSMHAQDYIQAHHGFQTAFEVLKRVLED